MLKLIIRKKVQQLRSYFENGKEKTRILGKTLVKNPFKIERNQ